MPKEKINRRNFLDKTVKIIATATGLSVAKLDQLLGADENQLGRQKASQYNIYQKSANTTIKGLKTIIENDRRVFENEFGRITPMVIKPREPYIPQDIFPNAPWRGCSVLWFDAMDVLGRGGIGCMAVFTPGGACGLLGECQPNNCNGQACPQLCQCKPNNCPGNSCPNQGNCKPGCACVGGNTNILNGPFFEQYRTDPYIQALMQRFGVTDSGALANEVNKMLSQRRRP